jgi:hypothetical protein
MSKLAYIGLAAAAAIALAAPALAQSGTPSAKAAIQVKDMVIVPKLAVNSNGSSATPWTPILQTIIKTSNKKDLLVEPSLECMLSTRTLSRSKNSDLTGGAATAEFDTSTAESRVAVRVGIDVNGDGSLGTGDIIGYPTTGTEWNSPPGGDDVPEAEQTIANVQGVTYCERDQQLSAMFGGILSCIDSTTDLDEVVTLDECTLTEEELELVLNSTTATSFNFVLPDVSTGVKTVIVEARIILSASDENGSATAAAAIGRGSLVVESLRLVKNQSGLICDGVGDDAGCIATVD